jgi:hypothetical protein
MDATVGESADTVAELPPEAVETGLTCLEMLARFHNVAFSAEQPWTRIQGLPFGLTQA